MIFNGIEEVNLLFAYFYLAFSARNTGSGNVAPVRQRHCGGDVHIYLPFSHPNIKFTTLVVS